VQTRLRHGGAVCSCQTEARGLTWRVQVDRLHPGGQLPDSSGIAGRPTSEPGWPFLFLARKI